jgi:Fe2+ or Zn2+ uptake regulation protein
MFLAKITGKQFVKHEHILCEGCGSVSVNNHCYVNITILKSRVKNLYGTNGKSISIYVTFLP